MRFWNIDFLRFIFAIAIVMFHVRGTTFAPPDWLNGIKYWEVIVDFFFVIAGFLLFYKFKPETDTLDFAKKRFFRLAPNIWFVVILVGVLSIFIEGITWKLDRQIFPMLMLNCVGYAPMVSVAETYLRVMWYVSALFWGSLFYFYISKIFDKKYLNLIIWLLVMICYAICAQQNGFKPGIHTKNLYLVFNIGVCRALASMGVGYFLSMAYNSGFLQNVKLKGKIFISILEGFLMYFLIYYLVFSGKLPCKSFMGYVVPFIVLFYFMLIKQGLISKLLDNKILGSLGKYSFSIYCFHCVALLVFKHYVLKQFPVLMEINPTVTYFIITLSGVVLGIILYYLFEKPISKYVGKKLKEACNKT